MRQQVWVVANIDEAKSPGLVFHTFDDAYGAAWEMAEKSDQVCVMYKANTELVFVPVGISGKK